MISAGSEEDTARIIARLRDMLEDADLTLREAGRRCGYQRSYLSQVFAGEIPLRLTHVERLLAVLGMSPAEFFSRMYPRRKNTGERRRGDEAALSVSWDHVTIYVFGIRAILELSKRLERCEAALERIARSDEVRETIAEARHARR